MARKTWEGLTSKSYPTAGNWKEGAGPTASDDVWLQGGQPIDGSDESGTAIDELLDQLNADIGTDQAYLQLDPDSVIFDYTSGTHYVDLGSADIDVLVRQAGQSEYSLYLLGSDLNTLTNQDGYVAVGAFLNDSPTLETLRQDGDGRTWIGSGTTMTTVYQKSGRVLMECAGTTVTVHGGTFITRGSGAITTINQYGGTVKLNSSGTVTTYNHYGGTLDATGDSIAKTITTYNPYTNGSPRLRLDPSIVTVTNFNDPTTPYVVQWTKSQA
jgi:hypothetical protein